ncbi:MULTISPECIES: universal stress protein [unclassified Paracoccus (in: a-proteobacteria)]|uniref:universal stress protein n=1 Tax=unclassified Paracoccus (in: a-proteobacteria) TaxID=2688777 RepID=UPI0015FF9DC7|nr:MULTISPECIES: universal stress protein [unclassified Paracoccus (in: a-proteobacteria)]MBB1490042.1 universal stress protein [Paracoccus sp. MC1854]MBB1496630.1 universal stress protein [Paracoccus sp. MC1862]QQO43648.1 universal stress protein [Paracoccus sp. MC1862]
MGYKTILTVITQPDQKRQIEAAVAIARREDAHLEVFAVGVDHTQTGYYYAGASAYVFQEAIDRAMAAAETLEAEVRAELAPEDIRWSVESAVAQMGGVSTLIAMRARFADLVVLEKPYGTHAARDSEAALEATLFEGGAPVLVLPHETVTVENIGRRVLVAWNQSDEALHAVRRALPVLKAAEAVEIAVVDPSPHSPEGSDPGGKLCQMLTRHGVKAEIAVLAKTLPTVSEVLNRRGVETGADLIVMGAYSKSRLREAIMGGATRHMLERATLPVLMAR